MFSNKIGKTQGQEGTKGKGQIQQASDGVYGTGGNRHGITLNLQTLIHSNQAQRLDVDSQNIASPMRSTGRFQLAAPSATFQKSNTDSKRTSELYNVDVNKGNVQELNPLVPRHSSINQNYTKAHTRLEPPIVDPKNMTMTASQRQLLLVHKNPNFDSILGNQSQRERASFKSVQSKPTGSQQLEEHRQNSQDILNDEIQLIATTAGNHRLQVNNSRNNINHLESSMEQQNNPHYIKHERGSVQSSEYQETMGTMMGRSANHATLLVQATAEQLEESQVYQNDMSKLFSDRAHQLRSNLNTIDHGANKGEGGFSPQKIQNNQYPENKSLSPMTGKVRYADLLPVHATGNRGTSQQQPHQLNLPEFGGGSNFQQDMQQSPTFRKMVSATNETPEKEQNSFSRLHQSHKVPTSTFIAPKRTITLEPQTANGPKHNGASSKHKNQTSAFNANTKPSAASSQKKQHKYYIDISDIEKMLIGSTRLLERSTLDRFLSHKQPPPSEAKTTNSKLIDTTTQQTATQGVGAGNFSSYILEVAGGDNEASLMLKFIEERSGLFLQHIFQMHRTDYRVYQIEDSALLTSVYFEEAKDQICSALANLNSQIQVYIKKQFQGRQGTARLGLTTEKELFNIFRQMFGAEIFGQIGNNNSIRLAEQATLPRRVMNEIWNAIQLFRCVNVNTQQQKTGQSQAKTLTKQIQHVFHTYQAPMMVAYLATKLLFYCRGKALYCSEGKHFPLHRAVFEGNLPMISRLISCKQDGTLFVDKNEIDQCGNSPLVLAIRMKNIDAVKILTDLYCSAKLNPFPQVLSAIDIAKTMKDRKIVEILMNSVQKVKQHYMEVHKDAIFRVLERLPDFSIDLHFECTSNFIPWMKHFTPNDTYHIYKQGSNLRLDMRFLGYKKLKAIESNMTVLFKGRNSGDSEGELLLVDHEQNRVSSIFEDTTSAKIERDLDNIMNDQDIQKKYRAEKVKIEPETDRKGNITTLQIEEFTVQKYNINSTYTMTKFKLNNRHVEMLTKYKTFEEYLKFMKIDIFSLSNPASQGFSARRDLRSAHQNSFAPFGSKDHHAMAQVSSRPQMKHAFAATSKDNSLLDDIEQGEAPGGHLQTQGDFGMDQRKRRDASINNCQMHSNEQKDDHSKTFRAKICSCEKLVENSNLGLTPIITKSTRRTFNANMWLCQDHPLSIETFLPLLQVLSFSSKQIRKLEQAIDRYDLPRDRFPLKAKVPIFMLVEATFQFKELQFGRQPDEVFQIDQRVIEKQRIQLQQHYQLIHDQSRKGLTFNTEEDIMRQNKTLTELYKQLSLPDQNGNEIDSDRSDGIDARYQQMLDDQDADVSMLYEESKTVIVAKDVATIGNINLSGNGIKIIVESRNDRINGNCTSSDDRLTPANEYDIAMDSVSHQSRQASTVQGQDVPSQPPTAFLDYDSNVKTARMIGSVKTMSQINEKHDKQTLLGSAFDIQYSSLNAMTQSRPTNETEQQYKKKLDANQQLIERLTGKPLSTQEYSRHTQGTGPAINNSTTGHQSNNQKVATLLNDKEITSQTVQERKRRRKELSRLLKLRKTTTLDRSQSKEETKMNSQSTNMLIQSKVQAMVKLAEQIGTTGTANSKTGTDNSYMTGTAVSENIIDSKLIDQRPNVNETVEKRKLVSYNNPSLVARATVKQQESVLTNSKINKNAQGRVNYQPVTKLNLPQQKAEDTEANVDSIRSTRIIEPPFSIVKKEAGFVSGGSSSQNTQDGIGTSHNAKASTADESSGQNSESNYNSISQRSFQSITRSLYNHAVAKGLLPNPDKSTNNSNSTNSAKATTEDNRNYTTGQLNGHSALKRRLEDQNHLQTIESEEVQGTEGTIVDRSNYPSPSLDLMNNPYQNKSTLKNLASALSNKGKKHPQLQQKHHSRQSQDHMLDARNSMMQNSVPGQQPGGKSADQKKVSLQSMLRPSVLPFAMTHEEKGELVNPNIVLNRLHQYVINNKDQVGSAAAAAQVGQIDIRKKQRGHTSYMSSSKLQDAGMLSPEALLGIGKGTAITKKRGSTILTAVREEGIVFGKRSAPLKNSKFRNHSYNKDEQNNSFQVLLTLKQQQQNAHKQGGNHLKKTLSDVDIML